MEKYKGVVIENSLSNKDILDKLEITKRYELGDWNLCNVLVNEEQISELSKSLSDGPWYIHLWKQGEDEIRVVFKGKIFNILSSDRNTWKDTLSYGQSLNIPVEQLDFTTD